MESGWLSLWRKRRYSFCIFKGRWWLYRQNAMKSQGDYSFPSSFRNAFWWGKSCFGALHYANSLSLLIEFWEGKKKLHRFLLCLCSNCCCSANQTPESNFNAIYLEGVQKVVMCKVFQMRKMFFRCLSPPRGLLSLGWWPSFSGQ